MTHDNTTPNTDLPNASDHVALRGGIRVDRLFFDAVRFQVESVLCDLAPGARYTARQICGFPFWGYLSRAERRLGGRCLAHLVAAGRIGLAFARRRPSYPLGYTRKPHNRIVFGASR